MEFIPTILVAILLVPVVLAADSIWRWWRSGRWGRDIMPRPYRNHNSKEHLWRERFRGRAIERANDVLAAICDAFIFNPDFRYNFSPDDTILQIYQSVYPRADSWFWWWSVGCDAQEIDTLRMTLGKRFGFPEAEWRNELTIGEIVEACQRKGDA